MVKFNRCTDGTTPTGCVATAMAQIIRYWEHPKKSYNWSIMPNQITSRTPLNNSTNEIAKLMNDVGISVSMQYSCGVSGAYTSDSRNALINTFKYSNDARYVDFNVNTIVQQLRMRRQPLIMRGQDSVAVAGHSWVCDGYKKMEYRLSGIFPIYIPIIYLHMNWGWNGDFNTGRNWFFFGTPIINGYNFSTGYKMIKNIHP